MERKAVEVLLALRRFVGVPLPGTGWRVRGFLPGAGVVRVRLGDGAGRKVEVELPYRPGVAPASLGSWWYVGALRGAAQWVAEGGAAGVVGADELAAAGVLPEAVEVTADDGLDYVVADLVGDPYWHAPAGTVAPDLYRLTGFDLRERGVVRLYLDLPDRGTVGIDVATAEPAGADGAEPGALRPVGWWASTKIIALLNAPESLEALRVAATDPHCDAVYDATAWA
ncbi:hypothetical protein LG634_03655 [Streptomyces bambusae]|uniref:hypothetical protein n=1 Tax=Streptomyces bambusae TaxID=1550616 RepID=UPI001CFD0914|nr:hypothetical protein [Streptomyces bambusae]MCB5163932.1 hypothetical protein [Streptomyces bambusae]